MRQLYAQTSMRLVTKIVKGLTSEKLEMIIHTMKDRGIHAAALQEAWAALPFFLNQVYRSWGHTAHRGWARLLLDRRSLVQVPNALSLIHI